LLLKKTRFGLIARGTMQNANMAAGLGLSPPRVYMVTFGIGAALAGAGGRRARADHRRGTDDRRGLRGQGLHHRDRGGASVLTGTISASTLFGTVNQLATFATTPVIGEVALLLAAIVLIRILPQGITDRFLRGSL
jgi:branched-chain amino acid transport system permease protein